MISPLGVLFLPVKEAQRVSIPMAKLSKTRHASTSVWHAATVLPPVGDAGRSTGSIPRSWSDPGLQRSLVFFDAGPSILSYRDHRGGPKHRRAIGAFHRRAFLSAYLYRRGPGWHAVRHR